MAVYAYFGMTLVGSQILVSTEENPRVDIYFPVFVVFKLILLIGWLKVANCIEKPFGTDDTDFQALKIDTLKIIMMPYGLTYHLYDLHLVDIKVGSSANSTGQQRSYDNTCAD